MPLYGCSLQLFLKDRDHVIDGKTNWEHDFWCVGLGIKKLQWKLFHLYGFENRLSNSSPHEAQVSLLLTATLSFASFIIIIMKFNRSLRNSTSCCDWAAFSSSISDSYHHSQFLEWHQLIVPLSKTGALDHATFLYILSWKGYRKWWNSQQVSLHLCKTAVKIPLLL